MSVSKALCKAWGAMMKLKRADFSSYFIKVEKHWLFYFIMAANFDTFLYWILKFLSYIATPFLD